MKNIRNRRRLGAALAPRGVALLAGLLLMATAGAAMPTPAAAQLVVDRLVVDIVPGAPPREDILLQNQSKDRYYITVSPTEILNPGADTPTKVTKTNPEDLGLLVTPNRLILDPGASRSIRIVSLNGPLDADRIYRILIAPQVGALRPGATPEGTRAVALKILTAYEALVIVRPRRPEAHVVAVRTAEGLVLKNVGNTNALLFDGTACEANPAGGGRPHCAVLPSHRMYAGSEWKVPLPHPSDVAAFQYQVSQSQDPRPVRY